MSTGRDGARLTVRSSLNLSLGQDGRTYNAIGNSTLHKAEDFDCDAWVAIVINADTKFTKLTDATADGDSEVGRTFYHGEVIYGVITEFQSDGTGDFHAYKASRLNTGGE